MYSAEFYTMARQPKAQARFKSGLASANRSKKTGRPVKALLEVHTPEQVLNTTAKRKTHAGDNEGLDLSSGAVVIN